MRRCFLSQRQHPAAVDQDLRIVPGKAFGKTLPVLHAGRDGLRQQQGGTRLDRHLLIEGRQADFLGRMEEQAARLRQTAKEGGGFRHLGQFQIDGLGGELRGRQDPLRPQQHDLRVVAEQAEIDARVQEGQRPATTAAAAWGEARPRFPGRPAFRPRPGRAAFRAAPPPGPPGCGDRTCGTPRPAIAAIARALGVGGEKRRADGETLRGSHALTPCPSPGRRGEQVPSPPAPLPEGEGSTLPSPPALSRKAGTCPHPLPLSRKAREPGALTPCPSPGRRGDMCPHPLPLSRKARGASACPGTCTPVSCSKRAIVASSMPQSGPGSWA